MVKKMRKNENKNKIEKQQMFSSLILRNSNKLKANYFYSYFQGYKRGYEKINNINLTVAAGKESKFYSL